MTQCNYPETHLDSVLDPSRPRICVVGAGAMGSLVGAMLMGTGADLTFIDHGRRLDQIRRGGLRLIDMAGQERSYRNFNLAEPGRAIDTYDVVFLAVKAYDLAQVAPQLEALVQTGTTLVTLQNGIPWWYFHRFGGGLNGYRLKSLDPDGVLARHVDADRVVGCVPYPAAFVTPDGAVKHVEGLKMPVGELDGSTTVRVTRLAALLEAAGFRSRILDDVRSETWLKAWGNVSFNPISALSGATLEAICRFAPTRRLAATMMREAQQVGEALGARFRISIDRRIAGAESVGPHRTSMLQDLENGNRLETEALIGAVLEMAEVTDVETPSISAVHALVRLLEQTRSLRAADHTAEHAAEPRAQSCRAGA